MKPFLNVPHQTLSCNDASKTLCQFTIKNLISDIDFPNDLLMMLCTASTMVTVKQAKSGHTGSSMKHKTLESMPTGKRFLHPIMTLYYKTEP